MRCPSASTRSGTGANARGRSPTGRAEHRPRRRRQRDADWSRDGLGGNGARPVLELSTPAVEEHRQRLVAESVEHAANVLAGEELPVQVAALVSGLCPADIELVEAHDGSSG